ncbi:MAG: sugar phosphate isomerase/epimerase [Oscillospiraceae bacterium]
MNYGISTACFYPMQTEQALLTIAQNNVPYAEVFVDTFSEVKKDYIKQLKKTADFYGTKIVSLHPFSCVFEPFMLFTNYERRFHDALEMHRYYFEAMNLLDAKIFVFHGDRIGSKNDNQMYFERFAKLRDLGKEYEITVAQENVERCKSRDINFLSEMIDYLDNDVSLVFDNKQAVRSGVDFREFITKFGDRIAHVHFSDNDHNCDCLPPGDGQVNLCEFLSLLKHKLYNNCIIIELYNELLNDNSEVFKSYDVLRQVRS